MINTTNLRNYLEQVDFALIQLFQALNHYKDTINKMVSMSLELGSDAVTGVANGDFRERAKKLSSITKEFKGIYFSNAIIAGSILQIAHNAIETYSLNTFVPSDLLELGLKPKTISKFCIGSRIKNVPTGLLIYAGRNQHMHCMEPDFHEATKTIFNKISLWPADGSQDPAWDLSERKTISYSLEIVALLEWDKPKQVTDFLEKNL